jgi:hypothetical protein
MGMHFTQLSAGSNLWLWESQSTPFPVLIILEHSRSLMNGLAAKMLALTTLRKFDGRMVSFAQVVDLRVGSRL